MSRQQKQRSHVDAILSVALIALATLAVNAGAQGWKPENPIEVIVNCAPGCGPVLH